jgi:hypothetical protein
MIERAETKLTIGAHALNYEYLFLEDRGGAAIEMGEEGFDDEMEGATQNAVAIRRKGRRLCRRSLLQR